jgi:hypothetical protein
LAITKFSNYKIVYRRFKALFIAICIDVNDSELAYLEFIQLFVEVLDHYFGEVKELDLIFNFNMVYAHPGRDDHRGRDHGDFKTENTGHDSRNGEEEFQIIT